MRQREAPGVDGHVVSLDDVPFNRFHLRAAAYCGGSGLVDGYVVGVGGFSLAWWGPQVDLSTYWVGAIGAASVFGLFVGSLIFGRIADQIGRRWLFAAHLYALILLSIAQLFADTPHEFFTVRFLMGIAVGANFAVAMTLLAELVPRKSRGILLSSVNLLITFGFFCAFLIASVFERLGDDAWRWLGASGGLPALAVLLLQIGAPESPRWLRNVGRHREARAVLDKFFGEHVTIEETAGEARDTPPGITAVFSRELWRNTAFAAGFWTFQALPFYVLLIYQHEITSVMGLDDSFWSRFSFNTFLVIGALAGTIAAGRMGRRSLLLSTFGIAAVVLAVLTALPEGTNIVIVAVLFSAFAIFLQAASALESVYPGELFPTELRATGVGVVTSLAQLASAVGIFVVPLMIEQAGTRSTLWCMVGLLVMGILITKMWAPETRDVPLAEASELRNDV